MSIVEHSASRSTKEGGILLPYPMLTSTNDSTWEINMERKKKGKETTLLTSASSDDELALLLLE
uniref:Uncharacterized protein n=1 Tax=Oryza rufipogon TaxID=4529 RepID=A0A0E0QMW7_ORYRU